MLKNDQNKYVIKLLWFFCLIVVLFFTTINAKGQKTGIFIFNDVEKQNIEKIKDSADFQNIINQKLNNLKARGYITSSIDSIYSTNDTITGIIYQGEQYFWDTIIFKLPAKQTQSISKPVYKSGQPVDLIKLERRKEEWLSAFEEHGYPFARVATSFTTKGRKLSLTINLMPGKQYVYDTLVYNETKISDAFLRRYLNLVPGDLYKESDIKTIDRKISQLEFLKLTADPLFAFSDKKIRTDLRLENTNANYFDGLVGIVPDENKKNKYILTGDLELSLVNTIGYGEQLDLAWKKNEQFSQQLKASAQWPYLIGSPLGINGNIEMLKEDTSFVDLSLRGGLFILFQGMNRASGYYKNKRTIVLSPKDTVNVLETNAYGTGVEFLIQRSDNRLNPSKGYKFLLDIGAGRRFVSNPEENDPIRAGYIEGLLMIQKIFQVYKRWSLLTQNSFEIIHSEKRLYRNELLRIGGLKTLRGFDENIFFANSYNIASLEIRWLFEQMSHFKVFADAGWVNSRSNDTRSIKRVIGFGAGLNLHTDAGIFSISYALGRYNNNPLRLDNAKIHFGYINKF